MALQPIDLQTMYSQMANVAQRVASEGQGAALSQSIQTQGIVNQNLQQSQSVQKTAANETQTGKIKADAKGSGGGTAGGQKKKNDGQAEELEEKKEYEIRDPALGVHINITR
ncbi:MAG: hypothetical protein IK094_10125 [Treponema sp.]|nr:hypothetical protein [Treponema sp.]